MRGVWPLLMVSLAAAERWDKLCQESYCTSLGDDCCAPGDQPRTCSNDFVSVNLGADCFGHENAAYLCCPAGTVKPPPLPIGGGEPAPGRHTVVSIVGDEWYINGEPTFKGRT